jgi:hypothetical protein
MSSNQINLQDNSFSVAIIEYDTNGDYLCTWNFPLVQQYIQSVCIKRISTEKFSYLVTKFKVDWIYIFSLPMTNEAIPDVVSVSLCIISRTFHPEMFQEISKSLMHQYIKFGDPTKVLEGYLKISSLGSFQNEIGTFDVVKYDYDNSLSVSCLKEIVCLLGVEFIGMFI